MDINLLPLIVDWFFKGDYLKQNTINYDEKIERREYDEVIIFECVYFIVAMDVSSIASQRGENNNGSKRDL